MEFVNLRIHILLTGREGVWIFPTTSIICCLLHLSQSVYRKIQAQRLQEAYNNAADRSVKIASNMLVASAFVPPDDVPDTFDEMQNNI